MVLASIMALSGGCIIPVPLDPSPGSNQRPQIITDLLVPRFTQPVTHSSTDRFEFQIVAEDLDIDDTLYAALERPVPNSTEFIGVDKIKLLPTGDVDHPNRRSGSFGLSRFCVTLSVTGSSFIGVLLSDRDFNDPLEDLVTAGLTDEAMWVLTCQ